MLSLDIAGALAPAITPSFGITDQELTATGASLRVHLAHILEERTKGLHHWMNDPGNEKTVRLIEEVADQIRTKSWETVLWIGIGGSGLGPKVLQEAFESPDTPELIVLDAIDPALLKETLAVLNWKRTLVVIASKSGTTLESMSAFFLFWKKIKEVHKEQAKQYVIGVTDPQDGPLRSFCLEEDIPMLPIPRETGGRFSIFTSIGLLPLVLLKRDIHAFLHGARTMDARIQSPDMDDNPALLLAGLQFLLDTRKDYPLRVIMPYSHRLRSMAAWNQQLIAESLGKTETHNPIPVAALGTSDQHSLLQQWMAGPRTSWHLFIEERHRTDLAVPADAPPPFEYLREKQYGSLLGACAEGTRQALTHVKRPHVTLSLSTIDEEHLGQLFFCFMMEVLLLGKLYRIDPYGQPAVELGKTLTKKILSGK